MASKTKTSRYVTVGSHDEEEGKPLTDAQAKFEEWMVGEKYELAVDCAPYDGREGGYQGTVHAGDLLFDYLADHPDQEAFQEELEEHAQEIGEVSNL
jgi:hypothetical protein